MNPRENLKAYLDGELSSADRTLMESALAGDEHLREELAALEQLSLAVKAGAREFDVCGYEELRAKMTSRRKLGVWWRTFGTVAVVGVMAAVLFPVFSQSRSEAATEPMAASPTQSKSAVESADAAPATMQELSKPGSTTSERFAGGGASGAKEEGGAGSNRSEASRAGKGSAQSETLASKAGGEADRELKTKSAIGGSSSSDEEGGANGAQTLNRSDARPTEPGLIPNSSSKGTESDGAGWSVGVLASVFLLVAFIAWAISAGLRYFRNRGGSGPGDSSSG